MTEATTRRRLLGAVSGLVAMATLTRCGSTPAEAAKTDSEWDRLYSEFQATAAQARTAMDTFNEAENRYNSRLSALGAKPTRPASPPFDVSMSLAAIVETTNDPTYKQDWASYERKLADWEAERVALRVEVLDEAEDAWTTADNVVIDVLTRIRSYPVTSIAMLSQKAEVLDSFFAGQLEAHDARSLVADIRRLAGEA